MSDGLPETLCSECHGQLLSINSFREQCLSSSAYLQDILEKHKESVEVKGETSVDFINEDVFEIDYLVRVCFY